MLEQPGPFDRVDIPGQAERHHIGLQTVDDRQGLLARAAMRLLDGDLCTGLLQVIGSEGVVDRLIKLAGRIIGDIEQRDRLGALGVFPAASGKGDKARQSYGKSRLQSRNPHDPLQPREMTINREDHGFREVLTNGFQSRSQYIILYCLCTNNFQILSIVYA